MSEPVISADNLTRRFGNFTAVDRVSFTIEPGEVVGYLGPNGSGKTTTIRMLLGLLLPSEGEASVLGFNIRSQVEEIRKNVGYMSQRFSLYHDLSGYENLAFYAGIYGVTDPHRIDEVLELVDIRPMANIRAESLSTGWRQRLALAAAIVHRPRLIILDEPTSGVDPLARRLFWDLIYELVDQGVTVLITTHYMDEAEYCGKVGIMNNGKLLAMDTPSNLKTKLLTGSAWDLMVQPQSAEQKPGAHTAALLVALQHLETRPGFLHVALAGDHLRLITSEDMDKVAIQAQLDEIEFGEVVLESIEPALEDVFLSLTEETKPE